MSEVMGSFSYSSTHTPKPSVINKLKKYIILLLALLGTMAFSACQTPMKSVDQNENPHDPSHNHKVGSPYYYR
jgi:hypothetical protein